MVYQVLVDGLTYPRLLADAEYLRAAGALSHTERFKAVLEVARRRGGFVTRKMGELVDDIPAFSIPWLVEQGHIRPKE